MFSATAAAFSADHSLLQGNLDKAGLRHGQGHLITPEGFAYHGTFCRDKAEG